MGADDFPKGEHVAHKRRGSLMCDAGPDNCPYCRRIKDWWDAQHFAEKWVAGLRNGLRGIRGVE